jgi:hypothetical protein
MMLKSWLGIFLVVFGCSPPVQEEAEALESRDSVAVFLGQRAVGSHALAFPLSILFPGIYHGDEVPPRAYQRAWLGLFQEGDHFELVPTLLRQQAVEDPILDEPGAQTGWDIQAERPGTCLFLLSQSLGFTPGDIHPWIPTQTTFLPGDSLRFVFEQHVYFIVAKGNKEAMLQEQQTDLNFSLIWGVERAEGSYTTTLWHIEALDDQQPELLFVGDLDRDGYLDVVVNEAAHYNVFAPALWLSGGVSGPEALRKLGGMTAVGC